MIEIGTAVTSLKKGDFVVTMVRRPCHHLSCIACQSEQQDFCYTGEFKERGINGLHGFMAEYVVDDEKYMVRVPPQLKDIAILTEPLTIAEKAVREIYTIQERLPWLKNVKTGKPYVHRSLVIGAGPVGLLAALVFSRYEFKTYVYSLELPTDSRAKIAVMLGADYISAKKDTIDQLSNYIVGNLDVIFDGSGASKLAFDLTKLLGYNGIFVWAGIPGHKESIDLHAGTLMRNIVLKNQSIVGSVNASRVDFQSAVQHLEALSQKLQSMNLKLVTRFSPECYEDLLLKPPAVDVFKAVIHFGL